MHKKEFRTFLLATVVTCVCATSAHAQAALEGFWRGAFIRDGAVQLVNVEFFREGGALKARSEIPDLPIGEPAPVAVTFENGKVQFATSYGRATLTLDEAAGEMLGSVTDDSASELRLHLKRAVKPEVRYLAEDMKFTNGPVTLAGTLIKPLGPGPHPAIVWIHGRGKAERRGQRGFARILTQYGVASLIYDKRGVGQSTGDHDKSGMYDFAGDAEAALAFLAKRKEIDPKQLGLYGNSAGGWVAAIVAARAKRPLAFVVTNVGPADSVRDQQIHTAEYSMRQSGIDFSVDEYAAARKHMGLVQDFAYTGKGWEALQASVATAKTARWARFVDLPESESHEDIQWVRLNQYDPAADLKKIKVPFLAMYGGADYVVPPEENVKKLERYLTEAGNHDFKIIVYPGADHGLNINPQTRTAGSGGGQISYWQFRKKAPAMIETTIEWLMRHVHIAGTARQ